MSFAPFVIIPANVFLVIGATKVLFLHVKMFPNPAQAAHCGRWLLRDKARVSWLYVMWQSPMTGGCGKMAVTWA